MLKKLLSGVCVLFCASALFAGASAGATTPEGWLDNFDEALAQAKKLDRPVLMLLTGSDWCPACMALRKQALTTKEFKEFAKNGVVLLFVDLPQHARLNAELAARNRALAGRFKLRGVPTTVILDASGKERGRIVGVPEDYVGEVKKIVARR